MIGADAFLKAMVTFGEVWIHHYDTEIKRQYRVKHIRFTVRKKIWGCTAGKVILTNFIWPHRVQLVTIFSKAIELSLTSTNLRCCNTILDQLSRENAMCACQKKSFFSTTTPALRHSNCPLIEEELGWKILPHLE